MVKNNEKRGLIMSVQNAGALIREARLKAGLTQEKLSDGICSILSLSRIENGTAGVSPSTFQALMTRAGINREISPIFASRTDFDCFYILKHAKFYLNAWQLELAYNELEKIEHFNWANNKYYYQEWLLLHCKLQFRSGCCDHQKNFDFLFSAIKISIPDFHPDDIRSLLLSITEIELLIAYAQEGLYLGKLELCLEICNQISTYIANTSISQSEKDSLLAEIAIVHSKYLIATKDYNKAYETANNYRHLMISNMNDTHLHELTFLTALSLYYKNKLDDALMLFKTTFFASLGINSCYSTICLDYIKKLPNIVVPKYMLEVATIDLIKFSSKKLSNISSLGDGIYDINSPNVMTLGELIKQLRTEQKISQNTLCYGLCSKSTLSKIENSFLQPEIALSQALLQRLGISDIDFSFCGNHHETQLYILREKSIQTRLSNQEQIFEYIDYIEKLLTPKDILYKQYVLFKKAVYVSDSNEKIAQLQNALSLTLPDFDINKITEYRLSWMELTILNNLGHAYTNTSTPYTGVRYFYKILDYLKTANTDILFCKRIASITIMFLLKTLYKQQHYSELINFFNSLKPYNLCIFQRCSIIATIYGYYCQALGECNQLDTLVTYANFSYSNYKLYEDNNNSQLILSFIKNDFKISIF